MPQNTNLSFLHFPITSPFRGGRGGVDDGQKVCSKLGGSMSNNLTGIHDEIGPIYNTYNEQIEVDTRTKKIIQLLPIETNDDYKVDPVVFALSVDPMADKYPNISPYAYCNWNPVMLVDPDGRDVFVTGPAAEEATNKLSTKNITVSRGEDGKLCVDGKAKNRNEKLLVKAIESDKVKVNLTAENSNLIETDKDGNTNRTELGGAFMGNKVTFDENGKAVSASTKQFVSMDALKKNFEKKDIGDVITHEITESFKGGIISMRRGMSASPAYTTGGKNAIYNKAHNRASYQPYEKQQVTPTIPQQEMNAIINTINR